MTLIKIGMGIGMRLKIGCKMLLNGYDYECRVPDLMPMERGEASGSSYVMYNCYI
jgi:hypothetical protein